MQRREDGIHLHVGRERMKMTEKGIETFSRFMLQMNSLIQVLELNPLQLFSLLIFLLLFTLFPSHQNTASYMNLHLIVLSQHLSSFTCHKSLHPISLLLVFYFFAFPADDVTNIMNDFFMWRNCLPFRIGRKI